MKRILSSLVCCLSLAFLCRASWGITPANRVQAEYHFSMAQAYATDGNIDRAIEEYRLTLIHDPDCSLAYARLAGEYVKKGMLVEAKQASQEALRRNPKDSDVRLILAGLYSASHETKSALKEYDFILKGDPHNEEAAVYKSQLLLEAGRNPEALVELRNLIKRNPESAAGYFYLGRVYQHLNHFKQAIAAYEKAMEIKPTLVQAGLALALLYEENQMTAKAIPIYKRILDDDRNHIAVARLATIYLKDEKFQEALPYLKMLEEIDPEDMNVRVKLGLVYMELKQYDPAIERFKKILERIPDSDRVRYYLGGVYEMTSKPLLAIEQLKEVKPASHLFRDAALHAAFLIKKNLGLNEAKKMIQEAIAKAPKYPAFYLFQASLEEEQNDLKKATEIIENAVEKFPDDERTRYYLGSLYDRAGEIDKSLGQMETLLKQNPANVDALNYIGYTWTQKGIRLGDAEKLLRRALVLRPDNGYVQDSWGWHLFRKGKVREAVVELEKAARLKPDESTILEHLGDVYLSTNLREKAFVQYEDAIKYAIDEKSKKKIQDKLDNLRREMSSLQKRNLSDPPSLRGVGQGVNDLPASQE